VEAQTDCGFHNGTGERSCGDGGSGSISANPHGCDKGQASYKGTFACSCQVSVRPPKGDSLSTPFQTAY